MVSTTPRTSRSTIRVAASSVCESGGEGAVPNVKSFFRTKAEAAG